MLFMSPTEAIVWLTSTTQGFTCWPSHLHSSCAFNQNDAAEAMPSCKPDVQNRTKVVQGMLERLRPLKGLSGQWTLAHQPPRPYCQVPCSFGSLPASTCKKVSAAWVRLG